MAGGKARRSQSTYASSTREELYSQVWATPIQSLAKCLTCLTENSVEHAFFASCFEPLNKGITNGLPRGLDGVEAVEMTSTSWRISIPVRDRIPLGRPAQQQSQCCAGRRANVLGAREGTGEN
jgi:hypothetical protein